MHGEYKVPGGRLVVTEVGVQAGQLRHVRVGGDFFLETGDALTDIGRALEGAPADASRDRLAARIDAALPHRTVLPRGASEAVATAVRRALTQAADWTDYDWQLVHEGPQSPALHMALDEVLTTEVAEGRRPPTLRIWDWVSSAAVIGSFQSLRNEVDSEAAERHGITVVRRISGGGAMFVEPADTITYSLCAPERLVRGLPFADSYAYLDDWVLSALGGMGVRAWYRPLNDIATERGKIAGAAQKRVVAGDGAVLHHVTMAYDIDAAKMLEVLRIGRERLSEKGTRSAQKRVDPLRRQTGLPRAAVVGRMIESFRARYGLTRGEVTGREMARARRLAAEKFSSREWTARVP